jgi:hypothetical protein
MPHQVTKIKVFVASSSDVKAERESLAHVVDELNRTIGAEKGLVLELLRWETHCYPNIGRIQGLVNEQIGSYDIFVGVMWRRFGTPTGLAESGTEEEFRLAFSSWEQTQRPHIMFYFSNTPYTPQNTEDAKQLGKVLEFRDELTQKGLVWSYDNVQAFPNLVRPHLALLLGKMFPNPAPFQAYDDFTLLHKIWDYLEADIQDALLLAYNQSKRENAATVSTKRVFAALCKLRPEPLSELLDVLPEAALPEPTPDISLPDFASVEKSVVLSSCVSTSIRNIAPYASSDRLITAEDVFVDIAKHGTGASVKRLRDYNVTPEHIDYLVREKGWNVIQRQ